MKTLLTLFHKSIHGYVKASFKNTIPKQEPPLSFTQKKTPGENIDWARTALQLQENLNNNQLGIIIKSAPLLSKQINMAEDSVSPVIKEHISHICQIFGSVNRCAAERVEAETWFKKALQFDNNNNEAKLGLASILAEKGHASINTEFIDNIATVTENLTKLKI